MATNVDPLQHLISSSLQDVTPVRLKLLLVANVFGALLFCLVTVATVEQHERAVQTIGSDAAPSVIAAHAIKSGMEVMNTDLVNELLSASDQKEAQRLENDFHLRRELVGKQLVVAARNITYGASEQLPIEEIINGISKFEMQAQSARESSKSGNIDAALNFYRNAQDTLREKLLPSADALNKANVDALESTYSQIKSESGLLRGIVTLLGLGLIALLVYTQLYISKRFRRRVNLLLLLATVCTAFLVNHVTHTQAKNSFDLKVAKEDAYNSIVALLNARSDAYEANASQSSWLLDPQNAAEHEKYFTDKANQVAQFAPRVDVAEVINHARKELDSGIKVTLPGVSGSLCDEVHNIGFEGEGEPALQSLKAFADFLAVDSLIRHLERSGAHEEAVRLCLSYTPGASNDCFTHFDEALSRALIINQRQFERAAKASFDDLHGLVILTEALLLLVIPCVYFGLRPRMAEYL